MDCGVLLNLYFKRACNLPEYNPAERIILHLCFNKHFLFDSYSQGKCAPSEREGEKGGGRLLKIANKNLKRKTIKRRKPWPFVQKHDPPPPGFLEKNIRGSPSPWMFHQCASTKRNNEHHSINQVSTKNKFEIK
jgi:hypothetical protein